MIISLSLSLSLSIYIYIYIYRERERDMLGGVRFLCARAPLRRRRWMYRHMRTRAGTPAFFLRMHPPPARTLDDVDPLPFWCFVLTVMGNLKP